MRSHERMIGLSGYSDAAAPIDRQLTTPFTSRLLTITGSCEKSLISMSVVALASGLFGCTLVNMQVAVGSTRMCTVGLTGSVRTPVVSMSSSIEMSQSICSRSKSGTVRGFSSADHCGW